MEREKVVKIESGWKCYCPHCGKVIVDLECDQCSKYSHGIWSFIKGTLIKYGFPLLAALSWIRWIYYSNKLQRARGRLAFYNRYYFKYFLINCRKNF